MNPPAIELTEVLTALSPPDRDNNRALDLACGEGRHSIWLRDHGWRVTAVDIAMANLPGVTCIQADLERHGFPIEPAAWNLIVCWLYWQEDLLAPMRAGVKPGGIVALAGKSSGRFATSLENYRQHFHGWKTLYAGEDLYKVYFIAQKQLRL